MGAVANAIGTLFTGPKMPKIPAPPPPPNALQSPSGTAVQNTGAGTTGFGSTLMTSPQGLVTPASTSKKSLLGG